MKTAESQLDASLAFCAFSEPTRLRILHLLHAGEICVGDVVNIIKVPQPKVSRHLAYLRKAKLVVTRREGAWTFYALCPAQNAFHKKLLECLAHCFETVPEIKTDTLAARRLRKSGGCCPR